MKIKLVASSVLLALLGIASAQQVNSSNSAGVSGSSSLSADKSGANVQSDNKADASSQNSVDTRRQQSSKETKSANHPVGSKDEKSGSMDATNSLAAGTAINAVLAKPIDSRKCKPGDPVVATATEDVKSDGQVVVRKGSKLIGHVTETKAKGEGQATSSLGIVFDHALLKNGQQLEMNSVVQAIAAGRSAASSPAGADGLKDMGSNTGVLNGGAARGGAGALGGVGSTVGSTTGAVTNAGGNATGAVNSTLGSTTSVGNGLHGALSSTSRGVVGLNGLSLASDASSATQGSLITSTGKSVHLDSGTQLVLRVVN
jgi:hypothetical protein